MSRALVVRHRTVGRPCARRYEAALGATRGKAESIRSVHWLEERERESRLCRGLNELTNWHERTAYFLHRRSLACPLPLTLTGRGAGQVAPVARARRVDRRETHVGVPPRGEGLPGSSDVLVIVGPWSFAEGLCWWSESGSRGLARGASLVQLKGLAYLPSAPLHAESVRGRREVIKGVGELCNVKVRGAGSWTAADGSA